ncbi:MAG: hypothetical protein ABSE39_06285 [Candidatus Bathyarchaeia archaeon]|jgi:hypothetical protein
MPKKKSRGQPASKSKKFEPVPKAFHTVTPYLAINGAAEAIGGTRRPSTRRSWNASRGLMGS